MGMSVSAVLMLGCSYQELLAANPEFNSDPVWDNDDIDKVPPYFDAPIENIAIGYILSETDAYSASEYKPASEEYIAALSDAFFEQFGVRLKLLLTPLVS